MLVWAVSTSLNLFESPEKRQLFSGKVSSKNLSPVTKPQHLRGVKTNPIKFSVGQQEGQGFSASSQQQCSCLVRLHTITCCQPLVWGCLQPQPPTSELSSPAAFRAQELTDFASRA